MNRMDKVNKTLQKIISNSIAQISLVENALITITYVNCAPDFSLAKIGVSILPDKLTGTALRKIRKNTHHIVSHLKNNSYFKKTPKLVWVLDTKEREIAQMEKIFDKIHQDNEE